MNEAGMRDQPRDTQLLLRALGPVLAPDAARASFEHAREAARALGLSGLDRLLGALAPHEERGRPPGADGALARLRRAGERALGTEGLDVLREADASFAVLARELEPPAWAAGERQVSDDGVALLDVLEGWPVANRARLRNLQTRLEPRSAAALRTALDWLIGGSAARAPLQVAVEDSVLAVVIERARIPDAAPLDALLAGVSGCAIPGGSPGAEHAPRGSCVVRLPLRAERPLHLVLRCGDTPVAVPWPNVLRFYLVPRVELDERRSHLGVPVLDSPIPIDATLPELPVVLIGLGMRRGYVVADRLVWRLPASPCDAPGPAPPGEGWRAVCGEDGEVYWVLDPQRLLRDTAPAEVPAENRDEPEAPAETPAAAVPAPPFRAAPEPPPAPTPLWLADQDVEPIAPGVRTGTTATLAPPPLEISPGAEPIVSPPPRAQRPWRAQAVAPAAGWNPFQSGWARAPQKKRALIAEDSIAASLFLARMLEQRGFEVRIAQRAAECFEALDRDGSWDLVCVDVELPDGRGAELLRAVRERAQAHDPAPALVALVRDAADVAESDAADFEHTLRKPFDHDALVGTLRALGLMTTEAP